MQDDNGSVCFQEKFVAKLASYTPIIAIVNACTAGGRPSRRSEVTRVMQAGASYCDDPLHNVPLYQTDHPSIWGSHTQLTRVQEGVNS